MIKLIFSSDNNHKIIVGCSIEFYFIDLFELEITMANINEILKDRRASLVEDIRNLSKNKFFSIRSLDYCRVFVEDAISKTNPSEFRLQFST